MITQERLRELLRYDPETGHFFWLAPNYRRHKSISEPAGVRTHYGYIDIPIDGVKYKAHRLAWLYVYGEPIPKEIDHEKGDRSDNRIAKLRAADRFSNSANSTGWKRKTGLKGAYYTNGSWWSKVMVRRKLIYLGSFPTERAAHEAYVRAAIEHFGEFANAGHRSLAP